MSFNLLVMIGGRLFEKAEKYVNEHAFKVYIIGLTIMVILAIAGNLIMQQIVK